MAKYWEVASRASHRDDAYVLVVQQVPSGPFNNNSSSSLFVHQYKKT